MKSLFVLLISVFCLQSPADETVRFDHLAQQMVDDLMSSGVNQVGNLRLQDLKDKMGQIDYKSFQGKMPDFAGDRESAYYTANNEVYFREDYPKKFKDAIQLLATHEALGALNFDDNDYELSIYLNAIASQRFQDRSSLLTHPVIATRFGAPKSYEKSGGGATGVGGGGDFMSAWIKFLVTENILKSQHWTSHLVIFAFTRFEPYGFGVPHKQITIQVDKERVPFAGIVDYVFDQYKENPNLRDPETLSFLVRVPSWYYQSHPEDMETDVQELSEFIKVHLETMVGHNNEIEKQLKTFGRCGPFQFVVAKQTLESDLLKRSGGVQPFLDDFISNYSEFCDYEAEF